MINDRLLSQAVDIIKSSKEIVVFTGAGLIFINRDNTIIFEKISKMKIFKYDITI
ncbi:MAG: hypothetical protein ACFFAK_14170 [Promethearchaeota archaeon]